MKQKLILFVLVIGLCIPTAYANPEQQNTLTIETEQEFLEFALQCRFDGYSAGLNVVLNADIDLTETDFTGVPVFLGYFDGRGHTITYATSQSRDKQGVFLRVELGATIINVKVRGEINADYSKIGGVVAENYGTLNNVHFNGIIKGDSYLGGICAVNYGTIYMASVQGGLIGKGRIGGVVGENYGTIYLSKNYATINHDISEINFTTQERFTLYPWQTEEISDFEDLGGIAGVSFGLLQSCTNYAAIGYPETGYNVGGIVGRQSGYVNRCTNQGEVKGRQSVGGIVGEMTPHIETSYSPALLQQLRQEMDTLSSLSSQFNATAKSANTKISAQSSLLLDRVNQTRSSTELFYQSTQDVLEYNLSELNRISVTLTETLDQIVPILEWADLAGEQIGTSLDHFTNLSIVLQKVSNELEGVGDAFDGMSTALSGADQDLSASLASLSSAISELARAGNAVDQVALARALVSLSRYLTDVADGLIGQGDGLDFDNLPDSVLSSLVLAAGALSDAVDAIDFVTLFNALELATGHLSEMVVSLNKVREHLVQAGGSASDLMDVLEQSNLIAQDGLKEIEIALNYAGKSSDYLGEAMDLLIELVDGLSQKEEIVFSSTSPELEQSKTELSQSFDALSDQMETLFTTVESNADYLISDMERINLQFNVVLNLMIDIIQEATTPSSKTLIEDRSSEEIDNITAGKIYQSTNIASVQGISRVGGIAGDMKSESLFDWEPLSTATESATQYGISVIQSSHNSGKISAKRDSVGGIVGFQDFGLILQSEAQCDVSSAEGSYIGGIVGQSSALVWDCFAKATLTGERYVGGIVGYGTEILRSYGLVSIEANQGFMGAIAGEIADDGVLLENYFVSEQLGGLAGVSYAGRAQAITYEELLEVEGVPHGFSSILLRFYTEDTLVSTEITTYGGDFSQPPTIPEIDGYFAFWEEFSMNNVQFDQKIEAQYQPLRTTIASKSDENQLALFLVDGSFTDQEQLTVTTTESGYAIEVHGDKAAFHTVRHFTGGETYAVRAWLDDMWHPLSSEVQGKYVVFELPTEYTGELHLQFYKDDNYLGLILLVLGGAGAIAIAIHEIKKKKKVVAE